MSNENSSLFFIIFYSTIIIVLPVYAWRGFVAFYGFFLLLPIFVVLAIATLTKYQRQRDKKMGEKWIVLLSCVYGLAGLLNYAATEGIESYLMFKYNHIVTASETTSLPFILPFLISLVLYLSFFILSIVFIFKKTQEPIIKKSIN